IAAIAKPMDHGCGRALLMMSRFAMGAPLISHQILLGKMSTTAFPGGSDGGDGVQEGKRVGSEAAGKKPS
ncbi:MAG: hypothetical protein R6T96_07035, partial [Longimicrobiales bacterium]